MNVETRSRIGTVKTNRLDKATINKEQKKFIKFQNLYCNVLMNVSISIKTLEELTKQTEAVATFIEYCPAFYNSVIHNFWAQSVIELNKCFTGYWSFYKALDYIKANWNKIYTGKWVDEIHWNDNTVDKEEVSFGKNEIFKKMEVAEQILGSEENKRIIEIIKDYRDMVYAHTDKEFPKSELHLSDLKRVNSFTEKVFNTIFAMYDRTSRVLEPIGSDDVRNLIRVIEIYDKQKKRNGR